MNSLNETGNKKYIDIKKFKMIESSKKHSKNLNGFTIDVVENQLKKRPHRY